jgi:hypothetical protein
MRDRLVSAPQVDDLDFAIRKKSPEKAAAAYAAAKSALDEALEALRCAQRREQPAHSAASTVLDMAGYWVSIRGGCNSSCLTERKDFQHTLFCIRDT